MLFQKEDSLVIAASKAGMSEKTARKYLRLGKMPSEVKKEHTWQTREDPFAGLWDELVCYLRMNAGLEAQTLFNHVIYFPQTFKYHSTLGFKVFVYLHKFPPK